MSRKDIGAFICAGYLVSNRRPNKRFLFGEGAYYIFKNLQGRLFGRGNSDTLRVSNCFGTLTFFYLYFYNF